MVNTIKFSEFADANLNTSSNMSVGFTSGANYKTPQTSRWTTAQRPATPYDGLSGYNLDLGQWEYWSNTLVAWVQFTTGSVGVTQINTGTGLTGGPITSTGTLSFASIAANSLWANVTGSPGVPTVVPTSTFLKSANNLSDLVSPSAARSNLGLVIGTNVEAWSHTLDLIAAGTWPGATSITTLGTITTGLWHASAVEVPYGGTGNTTFTAYSVICGGTTATSAFQSVASVGSTGQVLTSNGAGVLPSWQNTGGSGTVNSGTANQIAYYATTGSAVSGLPSANNGVLITSGIGVPSISSTLPSAVQGNITSLGTITTGTWNASIVGMTYGGTGAALTPTNNELVYSTSSTLALLATGNNGVLVTSGAGVPSISSTLPTAVQANITEVGTISSGAWNGSVITVPFGGSGLSSTTAYAVVCGGTTSTSALQQVSGVGSSGQVLTSNGAAALPTWQNVSGTGTVNSAAINDLAYYAAAGNTISGLATAANSTLITDGTGVPSISATLPSLVQTNITNLGTVTVGTWSATTVTVNHGGTGDTSFTAYSVLCGGTTSTSALQNVSGVGISGEVLTSNGAGALPTWQSATGTGTVIASNANNIAYYATTGTAVSGIVSAAGGVLVTDNLSVPSILAGSGTTGTILRAVSGAAPAWSTATYPALTTANQILYSSATNTVGGLATQNSSVLVTDGSGVPSLSTTLPSGIAATNMALTTPTITNPSIVDSNGKNLLSFTGTASAVNFLNIANSATGVAPAINAGGTDSNITVSIVSKGTGGVALKGDTSGASTSAGNVGELISSQIVAGSAISISTNTSTNVTSILLTPGDWDVWGNITCTNTNNALTRTFGGISATSATLPDGSLQSGFGQTGGTADLFNFGVCVPQQRIVISVNTTYYLVATCTFGAGTSTTYGGIYARRRR